LLATAGSTGWSEVAVSGIFGDNMVLQRGMDVPVWGSAGPGEQVTVRACGQAQSTAAGQDGRWMVRLEPMDAAEPFTLTVSGSNEIAFSNVIVGDVWVCSGQSNMAMALSGTSHADEEIAAADFPRIRLCQVARATSQDPTEQITATWRPCSPATVGAFSAIGYYFGRDVHLATGVPIGLISTNWGGTPVEAWTSAQKLAEYPQIGEPLYQRWQAIIDAYPAALEKYNTETIPAWEKQVVEARAAGQPLPRKPSPPAGPDAPTRPSNLFNAMIHPLIPYAIAGAIWYQGESNARSGETGAWNYRILFPAMIADWRERWGQGDFPFGWVQLANYHAIAEQPGESAWAELRESQSAALALPNTGQALAIDAGMANDIHPKDKQTPAHRLALWALATVYGQHVQYLGPTCKSMSVEGSAIRVRFANTGGRLRRMVTPNAPYPSPLVGFQIAGADRSWVWAQARIERDTVVVYAHGVRRPVAVRYAWADNPVANLYGASGLPAVPFRTDNWPVSTQPPAERGSR
ncbi:MAG: sialate O-acetylesterase, partial [Armatimonadota bacterium]